MARAAILLLLAQAHALRIARPPALKPRRAPLKRAAKAAAVATTALVGGARRVVASGVEPAAVGAAAAAGVGEAIAGETAAELAEAALTAVAGPSKFVVVLRFAFSAFILSFVLGRVRAILGARSARKSASFNSFATAGLQEPPSMNAPASAVIDVAATPVPAPAPAPPPPAPPPPAPGTVEPPPKAKKKRVLDVFRKKATRAVDLEEMLESPPDAELDAPQRAIRSFSVAIAGLLIASVPEAALCGPAVAQRLAAPWVAARAGRVDAAPAVVKAAPGDVDAKTWAQRTEDVVSHYDFGVRATNAAKYHVTASASEPTRAVPEEDIALLQKELATLQAAGLGLDAAANAFADVVNAGLVPLVDAAVPSLKLGDAESLPPLSAVVRIAAVAGLAFEELGLVPFAGTPVVYEGRAPKSKLQSLFARYAAAGVAAGLDEESTSDAVDLAAVDTLQALFQISDKQADRLAQQVVTKLVEQMMARAGEDGDQDGLLAALAGQEGMPGMPGPGGMPGMPTDPAEQMAALRELVDSGQLSDDDKREIKKMFAESLGGGDVDEKIREANKNKDQLDPQAREALDLLNKLMV